MEEEPAGALTLNTLEQMQLAVVTTSGQMWDLDRSSLPPIFSQYWKLALQSKMSGPARWQLRATW